MSIAATWEEQVDFVRGMSPAAAKILWILLLSGRSLTGKDLMFVCGMSDKTIQHGLAWLEFKGLVQNNGKFNGWSLTAAVRQLPLPFTASLGEGNPTALPGGAAGSVALPDGESRKFSDIQQFDDRKISDHHLHDRKFSDHDASSSSSSSSVQTNTDLIESEEEEENTRARVRVSKTLVSDAHDRNISDHGQLEDRKISDHRPRSARARMRQCLMDAGIGGRSQKLREILSLNLDLDFVKGHIAAREAALKNEEEYPVNWLITKLLDGDPVPPAPKVKSHIPPELEGIIKR